MVSLTEIAASVFASPLAVDPVSPSSRELRQARSARRLPTWQLRLKLEATCMARRKPEGRKKTHLAKLAHGEKILRVELEKRESFNPAIDFHSF